MKRIVLSAVIIMCGLAVPGPEAKAEETAQLKQVVVTATRTEKDPQDVTQDVTVITSDDIQRSGAQTAAEAIKRTSGVNVTETGGKGAVTEINIRGANSEQVLILLDGRRLNSASAGGFDMSDIPVPLEDIDRIEIVRGASSALYGADAVGGVINIITKKPTGPSTTLKAEVGTHGWQDYTVGTSNKIDNVYYSLSAGWQKYEGYRVNSDLDQWKAAGKVGYTMSTDSSLELSVDWLAKELGVPGPTFFGGMFESPLARQWDRNLGSSITYKTKFTKDLDLRLNVFQNRDDIRYDNPEFPPASDHVSTSTGAEAQTNWVANSWNLLTLGFDTRQDHVNSNVVRVHTDSLMAAYLQDEVSVGKSLIIVLGGREDSNSVFGSEFSPKVSARYIVSGTGTIIRASAGKAFRAPTLNELFWPFDGFEQGNPDLQPEIAREYEAGIEQPLGKRNSIRFTYFGRHVSDMIVWTAVPKPAPVYLLYTPENIGSARVSGGESELKLVPFDMLTWAINYTYMTAIDQQTGDPVPGIPASQVKSYLDLVLPSKTKFYVEGRYVRNYINPGVPNPTHDYIVADAKISQPIPLGQKTNAEVYAGVKNMFNREYEVNAGYPMPPREWFGGLSFVF